MRGASAIKVKWTCLLNFKGQQLIYLTSTKSSPTIKPKTSFLLLNALYEITFVMSYSVIFSLILLKNCTCYVLRSINTTSPTVTYLLVNKCFWYIDDRKYNCLLGHFFHVRRLFEKNYKFNPKNIILETLCLCFSCRILVHLWWHKIKPRGKVWLLSMKL